MTDEIGRLVSRGTKVKGQPSFAATLLRNSTFSSCLKRVVGSLPRKLELLLEQRANPSFWREKVQVSPPEKRLHKYFLVTDLSRFLADACSKLTTTQTETTTFLDDHNKRERTEVWQDSWTATLLP